MPEKQIMFQMQDFLQSLPITILLVTGLLLMLLDAFKKHDGLSWVAGAGIILACVFALPMVADKLAGEPGLKHTVFSNMIRADHTANFIVLLLCASAFFTLFFIKDFLHRSEKPVHEIYSLIIFALIGMILLANAHDLIITFIGLETMSICLYVMAAAFKQDPRSNEAGLKYFLLGAFASAFFLYGVALVYGGCGGTNFDTIALNSATFVSGKLFYPAMAMMLVGFLFKVSAFPFHAWTPDVYSGAPTPLAGFMATGSKAAAFIAFAYFLEITGAADAKVSFVLQVIAVLTMAYGNIVAAQQNSLKRMLAYSSIAHSGYILLAMSAWGPMTMYSIIFYVFVYTLMNVGAFGLVGMAENKIDDTDMNNWKGIGMKNPWFGIAMCIFLFSLAGIPPLAGFFSKYFVFVSAVQGKVIIPAIIGILTSVIAAYYYIRVIVIMFFGKNETPAIQTTTPLGPIVGIALLAILVILLGAFPSPVESSLATYLTAH